MKRWIAGILLVLATFLFVAFVQAETTTTTLKFQWDSNTETDLDGYGMVCGTTDGVFDIIINSDIPTSPTSIVDYTAENVLVLINAPTYFAVDAFDTDGNRSGYSNSVPYTHCVPLPEETRSVSCAAGYTGSITEKRTSSCSFNSLPVWGAWAQISNTCKIVSNCVPTTQTRTVKCTKWYEKGSTTQKRTSVCNSNGTISWGAWTTVSSTCRPWYSK